MPLFPALMDQTQTKEILHTVKKSLDGVLLRDRAQLNSLMQRVRQRIREQKPTDQIVEKLIAAHTSALQRAQKRADQKLTLDYPEMLPISGRRDDIRKLIEENQVVIVCGTTGSGKTTQLQIGRAHV